MLLHVGSRMKTYLLAAPLLLAATLASCGRPPETDYSVIRTACLAEGDDPAYCDCYVDALDKNVSSTVARRIADGVRAGQSRTEAEDSLPEADLLKLQTLFPVVWRCLSATEE